MYQPDCQDWTPVTIHNKNHKNTTQYKQNPAGTKEFKKLNEDDIPKTNKISQDQRAALCDARNAKQMKQCDLAKMLNVNVNIIQEYENGTVLNFNKTFYNKMLRCLNVNVTTKK